MSLDPLTSISHLDDILYADNFTALLLSTNPMTYLKTIHDLKRVRKKLDHSQAGLFAYKMILEIPAEEMITLLKSEADGVQYFTEHYLKYLDKSGKHIFYQLLAYSLREAFNHPIDLHLISSILTESQREEFLALSNQLRSFC